jgi:tetratricopeptide (TPR) repeat protein
MVRFALVAALVLGMFQSGVGLPYLASAAPAGPGLAAETSMAQGWSAWQRGAFEEAVRSWLDAALRYAQTAQPRTQSVALTQLARAYQALGQYRQASQSLSSALELAQQAGDRVQVATVLGSLGEIYFVSGSLDAAQQALQEGLRLAREINHAGLVATLLNDLGNVFASQNRSVEAGEASGKDTRGLREVSPAEQSKYAEAREAYGESVRVAEQQQDWALAVRARTNAAMASIQQGQYQDARTRLDLAWAQMPGVPPSHDKAYSFINIGLAYARLSAALSEDNAHLTLRAAEAFNAAAHLARTLNDQRALSYALGSLGGLYEGERRYHEALQLTRQALFAAQQVQAPESLYRWQWQTGRLLKALGDPDAAITAYRQAVDTLQSFRQEMVAGSGSSRTSFRQVIGPVYFGLVDLLLQRAAALPDRAQYEPLLVEARDAVELFKAVELRDYFKDDCVDATRQRVVNLEGIAQSAITIYPILLPERTELLLSLPDGLQRVTVPVTAERLTQEVRELRRLLEKSTTREYLPHAQQLYDWLIRPIEPALASTGIDTLVFVPDGPLRTIPMAALHDGQQFLVVYPRGADKYRKLPCRLL